MDRRKPVLLLVVAMALIGTACGSSGEASSVPHTAPVFADSTPTSSLPKGFKPVTVLSTPNLACTLVSASQVASLLGGTVTNESLSDGSCRFVRSAPGAYGAQVQAFIEVQPVSGVNEHILRLLKQEKRNRQFDIDGVEAVWVTLSPPIPNPKSESGSLSTKSGDNFVSAGVENVQSSALGMSKSLLSTALGGLRAG